MRRSAPLGLTALVLLAGCATHVFVTSWRAPDAAPLQPSGARVAAVVMVTDDISRRAAEDALAQELTRRGAIGIPLYTLVPESGPGNEAAVRAALEKADVAGVVTMRPVDRQEEVVITPTAFVGPPYAGLWGSYWGYGWGSPWRMGMVTGGSSIQTNTVVSVETLVYSIVQNKLVWGGQTRTTNPQGVERLIRNTAGHVAQELERQGLLAR